MRTHIYTRSPSITNNVLGDLFIKFAGYLILCFTYVPSSPPGSTLVCGKSHECLSVFSPPLYSFGSLEVMNDFSIKFRKIN